MQGLAVSQQQSAGAVFINETKNIFITFLSAIAVMNGSLTLGMMLAVQYIIGQLGSPLYQLTGFINLLQDARMSIERIGEIHDLKEEETPSENKLKELPAEKSIRIRNLSFRYEGPHSPLILDNISLKIPEGKVTAVVGPSGSGKTTLIKMLLGFYPPGSGKIIVGNAELAQVSCRVWRNRCGVVMQDGFIFSDSIAKNIAVTDESIDKEKLLHAVNIANIREFIGTLPLGYNTKIGNDGHGLSQGQKQRILIARAVYKEPDFFFMDEATNALDADNERKIIRNLTEFFRGRTVVIVAHRLSTVKNADHIVVLENGRIAEKGTHEELTINRGMYFNLIKNQLELGNS
jgi:ATP-binding cassette subfamily B protein